jgi:hypothetical protein
MGVVEPGATFEMVVEKVDNAPEYLRAIWKNLIALRTTRHPERQVARQPS